MIDFKLTKFPILELCTARQWKKGRAKEEISGCSERVYAVGCCDRERCKRQSKMEMDDPLWRPLKEKKE